MPPKSKMSSSPKVGGGGGASADDTLEKTAQLEGVRVIGDGTSAIDSFARALNDPLFADVTFKVGPKEFHAHRCILASRSEVFKAMLITSGMKETHERVITVDDVDPDNFYTILLWAYTGIAKLAAREVLGVLKLAACYDFPDLVEHCRELARGFIDSPNVLSLLNAAIELGEEEIVNKSLKYLENHAVETIQQASWLTLCKTGVEHVLSLQVMDVSESLLFDRTLDWIDHNCEAEEDKKALLATFLPHIRFPQMTTRVLLDKVKPLVQATKVHHTEYVEALEFKLCPEHYGNNRQSRFRARIPSIVGKIAQDIPITFLEGWEKVVEQDAMMPLRDDWAFGVSTFSTTYICMGQRRRGSDVISICAIGNVDVAIRRGTAATHFYQDGSIYWCNSAVQNCFGFSPTPDQRVTFDVMPSERERKLFWQFQRPTDPQAMRPAPASQGLINFIFVK